MAKARILAMFAAATLTSAVGGVATASDRPATAVDFTVRSEPTTAAPNAGRAMRWDATRGRFGVTLGIQQPDGRPAIPNDVQAGAYFRITPSVRVGGSVSLGPQDLTPRANQARPADQPKVRLETAFKF
ncbi:MAG: NtrZ family periplasmic regulatory protein [Phenylobacterium sp.]|jgi:hypothetical protein